jgi:hypothetical protein
VFTPGEPLAFEEGALSHRRTPDGAYLHVRDTVPLSGLTGETIQLQWRNVEHLAFGTQLARFSRVPLCQLMDASGVLRPFGMQDETNRDVLLIPCTVVDVGHAITLPNTTLVVPTLFTLAQVRDKMQQVLPAGTRVTFRFGSNYVSEHDERFRMPLESATAAADNDDDDVLTVQVDEGAVPQYVVPPLHYMYMRTPRATPSANALATAYAQALQSEPMDVHVRLFALRFGQYEPLHSMQVHVSDGAIPLRVWVERVQRALSASYASNAGTGVRVRHVWVSEGGGWRVLGRQSETLLHDALPHERVTLVVEGLDERKARSGMRVPRTGASTGDVYYRLPPRAWFQDAVLEQVNNVLTGAGQRVTDVNVPRTAHPVLNLGAPGGTPLVVSLQLGAQAPVQDVVVRSAHATVDEAFVRALLQEAIRPLVAAYALWLAAKDAQAGVATHMQSALQRASSLTVVPAADEWQVRIEPGNRVHLALGMRAHAHELPVYRDAYEAAVLLFHHRDELQRDQDKATRLLGKLHGVPKGYNVAPHVRGTWQEMARALVRVDEPRVLQLVGEYLAMFGLVVLGEDVFGV